MKYTMTFREKILLAVLGVLILIVGYIQFFQKPIQNAIDDGNDRIQKLQATIQVESAKAQKLKSMTAEIEEENEQNGNSDSKIPEYNNLKNVMSQLSAILTPSSKYDITFNNISNKDNLFYRPIEIDMTCKNYNTAKTIIENIAKCPYRCSVDSIDVSAAKNDEDPNIIDDVINVKVTITFYELKKSD